MEKDNNKKYSVIYESEILDKIFVNLDGLSIQGNKNVLLISEILNLLQQGKVAEINEEKATEELKDEDNK